MRLTPFAKFFITVVILGVIGYAIYHYKGADVRKWATGDKTATSASGNTAVTSTDFAALKNAPPDPSRRAAGACGDRSERRSTASRAPRPAPGACCAATVWSSAICSRASGSLKAGARSTERCAAWRRAVRCAAGMS